MTEQDPGTQKDKATDYAVAIPVVEMESPAELVIDTRPTFYDFAGLNDEIGQLQMVAAIFENQELANEWDVQVPTAVLLCGPAGVGKTELVKAFSREIDANLVYITPSDIFAKYIGESNENLRDIFANAKSSDDRVVLFFDEIDSIFGSNAGGNSGVSSTLVGEMKTILSGLREDQPDTIVVGCTNSLKGFDESLLRPGRFDTIIQISPPDDKARAAIFGKYIDKQFDLYALSIGGEHTSISELDLVDVKGLAAATPDMTGADIKAILHGARTTRLMAFLMDGDPLRDITQSDILACIRQHRQQRPEIS